MKVIELFEAVDPLEELQLLMMLRSTESQISHEAAEQVLAMFQVATKWFDSGKLGPVRFVEDTVTGTLRVVQSSLPGGWASGTGAMTRWRIKDDLDRAGFKYNIFQTYAKKRIHFPDMPSKDQVKGPNIYFW